MKVTAKISEKIPKRNFRGGVETGWDITEESKTHYFISPRAPVEPDDTWKCICGKVHELGVYVAAHWDIKLTHTCECGIERTLESGFLTFVGKKKKGSVL